MHYQLTHIIVNSIWTFQFPQNFILLFFTYLCVRKMVTFTQEKKVRRNLPLTSDLWYTLGLMDRSIDGVVSISYCYFLSVCQLQAEFTVVDPQERQTCARWTYNLLGSSG